MTHGVVYLRTSQVATKGWTSIKTDHTTKRQTTIANASDRKREITKLQNDLSTLNVTEEYSSIYADSDTQMTQNTKNCITMT